jgi:hypothetical protein
MSKLDTIRTILGSDTTDKSVHSQALLDVLKTGSDENEKADLLIVILTERDSVKKQPETLSNKGLSQEDWKTISDSYGGLAEEFMRTAFFKSSNAHEFALEIVRFLQLFADDKIQTFLLSALVFSSPYVPYKELPGQPVKMTQHDFDHIIQANPDSAGLVRYISALPFHTVVEHASMLLQVLDEEKKKEVRASLLGLALGIYRNQLIAKFISNIKQ